MGYLKIQNLYKYPHMFLFKELWALEKIHGTSAHIAYDGDSKNISFFSGELQDVFKSLFNHEALKEEFLKQGEKKIKIHGECYGGKIQGFSHTYGPSVKFVAFDVLINNRWMEVPEAEAFCSHFSIPFVFYRRIKADIDSLNAERDAMSIQASRHGMGDDKKREGVVLRPLMEMVDSYGSRIIAKHKRDDFRETNTPRETKPKDLEVLVQAEAIAKEWVTPMRLTHVIDKLRASGIPCEDVQHTGHVIKAMVDDVIAEGKGEITWSRDATREVGRAAAKMFKERLNAAIIAP